MKPNPMAAGNSATPSDRQSRGDVKKLFVRTYGCQMNVYDSQRIADTLEGENYQLTDDVTKADLVLLNTCHIREKAAEKVYSEIGRLRKLKLERRHLGQTMTIGVAGCVAQAEGEEILKRAPAVDLVVGPQTYHRLPSLIKSVENGAKVVETDYAVEDKFDHLPAASKRQIRARGVTAFLTVQEGCDKFCTFCVVPYTRGAEISRPVTDIVAEARALVDAGVREITLLGQNVNAWHGTDGKGGKLGLGDLFALLAPIDGLQRLRYTTSHPRDMDDRLIAAHRDLDILMPYLHLPVQCGSDRILKAMNRRHDRTFYLATVEKIRKARPDIALSGDFIVGFPGETEEDFRQTLDIVRETGYAQAFSFKYSPRPGTPGAQMDRQVPEAEKADRLTRLQLVLNQQQIAFNRSFVGASMEVLLDKPGRLHGQSIGRSPWLQSVIVDDCPHPIGQMMQVQIAAAGPNSLSART